MLLQGWTRDRQLLSRALGRISPNGGTAMYDAVAEAIPLAQRGQNRKKALLRDLGRQRHGEQHRRSREVKQLIRESEVLVYAIGIDGDERRRRAPQHAAAARADAACRFRFPAAGAGPAASWPPAAAEAGGGWHGGDANDDRVNVAALRDMTDDSGGRTEIIRDARDLESGDGQHRRRVEQAVLPRLSVDRKQGRPLALDPRRSARTARTGPRARGYIAS